MGSLCFALLLAGSSFYGNAFPAVPAYASEVSDRTENVSVMEFLNLCDPESLIYTTVTPAQADEMRTVINDITKDAKGDYEKAKAIYDWVAGAISYTTNTSIQISSEPYQVFKQRQAVCGGFSNLIREMMSLADIPAVALVGYYHGYQNLGLAHQWSAVYVDNKWVYADATSKNYFDTAVFATTHEPRVVMDASLRYNDLTLGYYHGLAVTGCDGPSVQIPDTYMGLPITSLSNTLFGNDSLAENLHINKNINTLDESTLKSSSKIRSISVDKENQTYASHHGALFSKDMKSLLVYPAGSTAVSFTLPAETQSFDRKETFRSPALQNLNADSANSAYASYDGALYEKNMSSLLIVPAGKKILTVYGNAAITDTAFSNVNTRELTIRAAAGSPAAIYAKDNDIALELTASCSHNLSKTEAQPSTCQTEGLLAYWSCSDCGSLFTDAQASTAVSLEDLKTAPAEHCYGGWREVIPASCASPGLQVRDCKDCDHKDQQILPNDKAEHSYSDWKKLSAPTCQDYGTEERTCSICSHTEIQYTAGNLAEHQFGSWTILEPVSEYSEGKATRSCKICDLQESHSAKWAAEN